MTQKLAQFDRKGANSCSKLLPTASNSAPASSVGASNGSSLPEAWLFFNEGLPQADIEAIAAYFEKR